MTAEERERLARAIQKHRDFVVRNAAPGDREHAEVASAAYDDAIKVVLEWPVEGPASGPAA